MSLHSCASPGLYAVEVALAYIIEKKKGVLLATSPNQTGCYTRSTVTRSSSSNGHHVVGWVWLASLNEVRVTTVSPPAISGRESALRLVTTTTTTTTVVLPTVGRMTAPTRHLHNEKYHIQDELDISRTAAQSCSSSGCDELVTIKVTIHGHDPAVPQREGSKSWLSTLIILVSISLSFIFVFHRALPSCLRGFLIPSFPDATAQVPSDTTFPTPTSPAFSSNGRTDQVQWDNYTLVLRGQHVLIK
jgi:hypothetical protein